ncbi:unnamed protein product [Caretta caretta]
MGASLHQRGPSSHFASKATTLASLAESMAEHQSSSCGLCSLWTPQCPAKGAECGNRKLKPKEPTPLPSLAAGPAQPEGLSQVPFSSPGSKSVHPPWGLWAGYHRILLEPCPAGGVFHLRLGKKQLPGG